MGESSAKQQDEARARATLRRFIDIETKPTDGKRSFDELLGEMVKSLAAAFAEVRRSERTNIAKQIRENASNLVLFAGGNTRPLDLMAWILALPEAPEPPDQPGAERTGVT